MYNDKKIYLSLTTKIIYNIHHLYFKCLYTVTILLKIIAEWYKNITEIDLSYLI